MQLGIVVIEIEILRRNFFFKDKLGVPLDQVSFHLDRSWKDLLKTDRVVSENPLNLTYMKSPVRLPF